MNELRRTGQITASPAILQVREGRYFGSRLEPENLYGAVLELSDVIGTAWKDELQRTDALPTWRQYDQVQATVGREMGRRPELGIDALKLATLLRLRGTSASLVEVGRNVTDFYATHHILTGARRVLHEHPVLFGPAPIEESSDKGQSDQVAKVLSGPISIDEFMDETTLRGLEYADAEFRLAYARRDFRDLGTRLNTNSYNNGAKVLKEALGAYREWVSNGAYVEIVAWAVSFEKTHQRFPNPNDVKRRFNSASNRHVRAMLGLIRNTLGRYRSVPIQDVQTTLIAPEHNSLAWSTGATHYPDSRPLV